MNDSNTESGADKTGEQNSSVSSENESTGSSAQSSSSSKPDNSSSSGSGSSSSKPGNSDNSGSSSSSSKPSNSGNSGSSSSSSKPGNSDNSGSNSSASKPSGGNSGSSHTATPKPTPKPTAKPTPKPTKKPAVHTHNFVDMGVQSVDWTYGGQEDTGPSNTTEEVSAVNACLECGYFLGTDGDKFADRYYDHIWGPNASSCGGAYSLRTVYARYHLLQCSDPDCGIYKRGKFAYYEYLMYFDGNENPPTEIILTNEQIKELGL